MLLTHRHFGPYFLRDKKHFGPTPLKPNPQPPTVKYRTKTVCGTQCINYFCRLLQYLSVKEEKKISNSNNKKLLKK